MWPIIAKEEKKVNQAPLSHIDKRKQNAILEALPNFGHSGQGGERVLPQRENDVMPKKATVKKAAEVRRQLQGGFIALFHGTQLDNARVEYDPVKGFVLVHDTPTFGLEVPDGPIPLNHPDLHFVVPEP